MCKYYRILTPRQTTSGLKAGMDSNSRVEQSLEVGVEAELGIVSESGAESASNSSSERSGCGPEQHICMSHSTL